jgi:Ca2+-binding EF-hand superfamily protein
MSLIEIFKTLCDTKSDNINVKNFVNRLNSLDSSLKVEELYQLCSILDDNNDGVISIDEFLHYFQHLDAED